MIEPNFFYHNIFLIPLMAYILSAILKGVFYEKGFSPENLVKSFLGSGGMPSVHASIVSSITTAALLKGGIGSDLFGISLAFSLLFMYDAINLRNEAGMHAKELNLILKKTKFNESLGHTPYQVVVGSLVGILVALLLYIV